MKIFELKNKQVINEEDCCIIGCVIDIDFDPKNGCINIKSIGRNIIIVNVCIDKNKEKC